MGAAYPFPFFGSGDAEYFETAGLRVRFERAPTDGEREAIEAGLPPPLMGGTGWAGRDLSVWSDDALHLALRSTYEAEDGDDTEEREGSRYFAARSMVRAFNRAIAQWLEAAHAIVPIAVACRPEDHEAGGTDFDARHRWSVEQADRLVGVFADVLEAGDDEHPAARMLTEILEQVLDDDADCELDPLLAQWARPGALELAALRAGDFEALGMRLQGAVRPTTLRALARVMNPAKKKQRQFLHPLRDSLLEQPRIGNAMLAVLAVVDVWEDGAVSPALRERIDGERAGAAVGAALFAAGYDALERKANKRAYAMSVAATAFDFPERHKAFGNAGAAKLRSSDHAAAAEISRQGLELYPSDVILLDHYLGTMILLGRVGDVPTEWIETVIGVCHHKDTVLLNITAVAIDSKRTELARIAVEHYLEHHEALPVPALLNAALAEYYLGDAKAAKRWASAAKKAGDLGALLVQAALDLDNGKRDAAMKKLERARAKYPSFDAWKGDPIVTAMCKDEAIAALWG